MDEIVARFIDGARESLFAKNEHYQDDAVVDRLRHVLHHDREHSRALDLSDEGLLADLSDREEEAEQQLAIDPGKPRRKSSQVRFPLRPAWRHAASARS